MTAEIALLNKLAVTLAADSAVTISGLTGSKVYNSADKIFEGSAHDPIGIMVFNRPELSGIPIEVIVKMYRDQVCDVHYATVFNFADAFLKHVEGLDAPPNVIDGTIHSLIDRRAIKIRDGVTALSDEMFREATNEKYPSIDDLLSAVDAQIADHLGVEIAKLEDAPTPEWALGLTELNVLDVHGDVIGTVVDVIFEEVLLTPDRRASVMNLLALTLIKEEQQDVLTGLVFAGFGENEKFPSLVAYEVYGLVAGRLKFISTKKFDVDRTLVPDAAVYPFAQQEMVNRFMYGLDHEFLTLCDEFFQGAFTSLKDQLGELLGDVDEAIQQAVGPAVDAILNEFDRSVVPDHLGRLQKQFSDMVRSMPKQEMAALAESLVHITSLKRKFSADAESVGGPIDVAMITRAEGFVWVKRKHFFDASLNPRYFHRRYGGNSAGKKFAGSTVNDAE